MRFVLIICIVIAGCKEPLKPALDYKPDSLPLFTEVMRQDSLFFHAYNTCDMDLQKRYYSDSLEFYHDKNGLMTSKQDVLDGTKKYVCGRVTRELVKDRSEVYPIKGFGAIEMGEHIFHNSEEPNTPTHASKFIIIWRQMGEQWQITRVVSLH